MTKWWQVSKHTVLKEDKLEEVCICMCLNVLILNNNPKKQEKALARLDTDKWIEVMKAALDAEYCQGTFKLDILPLRENWLLGIDT
jgi:hypothetical protein